MKSDQIFPKSQRLRFFLASYLLSVIPLLLVLGLILVGTRTLILDRAVEQLETISDLKTSQTFSWIVQGEEAVLLAAKLMQTQHAAQSLGVPESGELREAYQEELLRELMHLVNIFPYVRSMSVVESVSGRVTLSTDLSQIGRLRKREPYFSGGMKSVYVSPVAYSVGREKPMLHISGPAMTDGTDVEAIVVAEMDLDDMQGIFSDKAGLGETGRTYLVDVYGYAIVDSDVDSIKPIGTIIENEGVQLVRKEQTGSASYLSDDGEMVLGMYQWLENSKMGLIVEIDHSEIYGPINTFAKIIIGLGLILIALTGIIAVFISSRFIAPIKQITDTARALEKGNLESRVKLEGPDEIRQLAITFNTMADSIRESHQNLELQVMGRTTELKTAVAKLSREIDDRKLAEDKLVRWGHVFKNIETGVAMGRADANTMDLVNPALARMHGYAVEEMTGMEVARLFSPDIIPKLSEIMAKVHEEGHYAFEANHIRKDGTIFPAYHIATAIMDDAGHPSHRVVSVQDISEIKNAENERLKLEEQLQHTQKMESLGILAGGIAHDFNNLLVGITGNISMAQTRVSSDSPAYDNLKKASTAAERAAELTNQMLAYSGRGQFVVKAIDLSSLLEEMIQLLKVAILRNMTLELDLSKKLPAVKADPTQIRQVIMNLITNAVEAVGDAPGTVKVVTGEVTLTTDELKRFIFGDELSDGSYVFLEISDPGIGMDQATVEKAFDPFFTTKETGRGLGLSAVLGIVKGHQGAIRVESEPGHGTTIRVIFPASEIQADTVTSESTEIDGYTGNGTVLVVDDDETVREVAGAILEQYGFDVLVASDGEEALEIFGEKSAEINLVLMDITMPVMGGLEALPKLRKIRNDVKVILSSGYTEEDTVTSAGDGGDADFIQKPYRSEELIQVVKTVLERRDDA